MNIYDKKGNSASAGQESVLAPSQVMSETPNSDQPTNAPCGPHMDLCRRATSQRGKRHPDNAEHQRWLDAGGPTFGVVCATHQRPWPREDASPASNAVSIGDGGWLVELDDGDYRIFDEPFEDSETELVDFVHSREASSWMDGYLSTTERPIGFTRNTIETDFEIRVRTRGDTPWEPRPHVPPTEEPFVPDDYTVAIHGTNFHDGVPPSVEELTQQRMADAYPVAPVLRMPSEEEAWEARGVATSLVVEAELREREYRLNHIERFGVCRCDLGQAEQYRLFMSEKDSSGSAPHST